MKNRKLDTDSHIFFYEQEFYIFSNFSAFRLVWKGVDFDTSEVAYHWTRFTNRPDIQQQLLLARSSHEAFKLAQKNKEYQRPNWDDIKSGTMLAILRQKVKQHPYVYKKLMETGERQLVEDSWRDSYWSWGEDRQGQNMLGKLWMSLREDLRLESRLVQTEG